MYKVRRHVTYLCIILQLSEDGYSRQPEHVAVKKPNALLQSEIKQHVLVNTFASRCRQTQPQLKLFMISNNGQQMFQSIARHYLLFKTFVGCFPFFVQKVLFNVEFVDRSAVTDGTNKSKRCDSRLAFCLFSGRLYSQIRK